MDKGNYSARTAADRMNLGQAIFQIIWAVGIIAFAIYCIS